jgi:hypothetical protein
MLDKLFGNLEKKTGVKTTEVLKLTQSLQNANFKDEQTCNSASVNPCEKASTKKDGRNDGAGNFK